jgi:hypothetical protein
VRHGRPGGWRLLAISHCEVQSPAAEAEPSLSLPVHRHPGVPQRHHDPAVLRLLTETSLDRNPRAEVLQQSTNGRGNNLPASPMTFDLAALKRQARQRDLARVQAAKDSLALRPSAAPAPQAPRSPARWLEVTLGAALDGPHATRDHDQAWQLLARCQTPCAPITRGTSFCALKGPPDCLTRRRPRVPGLPHPRRPVLRPVPPQAQTVCPVSAVITNRATLPSSICSAAVGSGGVASLLMHLDRSQLDLSRVLSHPARRPADRGPGHCRAAPHSLVPVARQPGFVRPSA